MPAEHTATDTHMALATTVDTARSAVTGMATHMLARHMLAATHTARPIPAMGMDTHTQATVVRTVGTARMAATEDMVLDPHTLAMEDMAAMAMDTHTPPTTIEMLHSRC